MRRGRRARLCRRLTDCDEALLEHRIDSKALDLSSFSFPHSQRSRQGTRVGRARMATDAAAAHADDVEAGWGVIDEELLAQALLRPPSVSSARGADQRYSMNGLVVDGSAAPIHHTTPRARARRSRGTSQRRPTSWTQSPRYADPACIPGVPPPLPLSNPSRPTTPPPGHDAGALALPPAPHRPPRRLSVRWGRGPDRSPLVCMTTIIDRFRTPLHTAD